jgi:lipopolysaccharide export LptBFGC system permease protein LptF
VQLRAPSTSAGVTAFVWALVFAVYIWLFMLGMGVSNGLSVIVAAVAGGAIFLAVRVYGTRAPRRRRT